ncbi:MAG: thioredoxin domain-containing protein [Patescibacteria group bacterium]|jgi:protein-disulfide isomerase
MEHNETNHAAGKCCGNMLGGLPPISAFIAGVVTTLGVVFAAGFVLLLVMMAKGLTITNASADNTSTATTSAATNTNTANTNTAVAANANTNSQPPKVTGKINLEDYKIRGTGDITLVEFSDTECPFCKNYHETLQKMLEKYDGKVRWAYKNFPLESLHSKAKNEAIATECAGEQGKFWDYIDKVYAATNSNDSLDPAKLTTFADELKLDRTKFDACLSGETTKAKVEADMAEGDKYGVTGTPNSFIVDKDGNILEWVVTLSQGRWTSGAFPLEGAAPSLSSFLDKYVK